MAMENKNFYLMAIKKNSILMAITFGLINS